MVAARLHPSAPPLQDATDLVARMCAFHHQAQTVPGKADLRFMGLDLVNGKVRCRPGKGGEASRGCLCACRRMMIPRLILHFRPATFNSVAWLEIMPLPGH